MKNRRVIATAFGAPDLIRIINETSLPEPQTGEVRIRVEASSVVSTDTFIRRGLYPFLSVEPPFTLGYDVVGVIDKVGEGVTGFQPGLRVADLSQIGGNADYCIRPATHLVPVPDRIDPAEAVSL
ncbi:alcohol dehydrogenase catalytic domain-containing protein, partial [Persicitalea sp.]|uniref:alcohol dehydrogenase catalytic domain-containing protein n=1 Tax=Persicitalea sp. TaxID=3100273 RepID=UPI00359389E2